MGIYKGSILFQLADINHILTLGPSCNLILDDCIHQSVLFPLDSFYLGCIFLLPFLEIDKAKLKKEIICAFDFDF